MSEFGREKFGAFEFGGGRIRSDLATSANATAAFTTETQATTELEVTEVSEATFRSESHSNAPITVTADATAELDTTNRVRTQCTITVDAGALLTDSVATATGNFTADSTASTSATESGVRSTGSFAGSSEVIATTSTHTTSAAVAWGTATSDAAGYASGLIIHTTLDARGSPTAGIFTTPTQSFAAQHPELVGSITPSRDIDNERERLEGYLKTPFTTPRDRDGKYANTDYGGLIAAFAEFAQGVATTRDEVLKAHYINYAGATALDRLGALVFVTRRRGETDDHYRPRIKTALQRFLGGATLEQVKNTIATLLDAAPSEIDITEPRLEASARITLDIPDSTLDASPMSIRDLIELVYLFRAGGVEIAVAGRGYFQHRSLEEYVHDINQREHAYDVAPYAGLAQTQGGEADTD